MAAKKSSGKKARPDKQTVAARASGMKRLGFGVSLWTLTPTEQKAFRELSALCQVAAGDKVEEVES